MRCQVCDKQQPEENLNELDWNSGVFQCDTCWDKYGEACLECLLIAKKSKEVRRDDLT
jgi:hypothetical protein